MRISPLARCVLAIAVLKVAAAPFVGVGDPAVETRSLATMGVPFPAPNPGTGSAPLLADSLAPRPAPSPLPEPERSEDEELADRIRRQGGFTAGTVRTADGTPVPGAFVSMGDLDDGYASDLTDGDGRFALDEMPSYTTLRAVVLRDGIPWRGETPADGGPFEFDITVAPRPEPRDRVVLVTVVDPQGSPVPRARVTPVSGMIRGPAPHGRSMTAAGGRFPVVAARWHRGEIPVFLVDDPRDAEGGALPLGAALVSVDPAGPAEVEVRLPGGALVEGRVVGPDGEPMGGVTVSFAPALPPPFDPRWMDRPRWIRERTWTDGRFAFAAARGAPGTLVVAAEEGVHAGCGPVEVLGGGADAVLRLRAPADLRVLVVGPSGDPVGEGWVTVAVSGSEPGPSVWLDDDGTCTVTRLPAGEEVRVRAMVPGFAWTYRPFRVDGSEAYLLLEEAGVLTGRVLGPDGGEMGGVGVLVKGGHPHAIHFGEGGTFSILGLRSEERVTLALGDGAGRMVGEVEAVADGREVVLRWPEEEDHLTLLLENLGHDVDIEISNSDPIGESTGIVLFSRGRRIARASTSGLWSGELLSFPSSGLPDLVDIQIGPTSHGRFAFLRGVHSSGFLRVEVRPGASIRGRVTLPGGDRAAFVEGTAVAEGEFTVPFVTDRDGDFTLKGLPPGRVVLTFTDDEGRRVTASVEAPAGEILVEMPAR